MVGSLIGSSFLAIISIGLIHGFEPGHGWPVAALLSTTAKRRYAYGFAAGTILSGAHFTSSLAVVAVYYAVTAFFGTVIDFGSPWFKMAAAIALFALAYRFFREKGHIRRPDDENVSTDGKEFGPEDVLRSGVEHARNEGADRSHFGGRPITSLKALAGFAFVLGFAHEEEFMLFALFVGGVNPLIGMSAYATAVTISLISITLLAIKAFSVVEAKMNKFKKYVPKVTGFVLVVLGILFLLPVFGGPNVY